ASAPSASRSASSFRLPTTTSVGSPCSRPHRTKLAQPSTNSSSPAYRSASWRKPVLLIVAWFHRAARSNPTGSALLPKTAFEQIQVPAESWPHQRPLTVELTDAGQIETLLRERVAQLESLSRLSEVVARAARVEDTYDAALDCVAETLSPDRASVLLFDDDGVIRFKAWRGLSDAYRRAAEGHSPWSPETTDPEPVLVADVVHEPALAALRPVVEAEGIRSLGFFPLVAGSRLLGKFMVYFDRP